MSCVFSLDCLLPNFSYLPYSRVFVSLSASFFDSPIFFSSYIEAGGWFSLRERITPTGIWSECHIEEGKPISFD